ncbi:uncharacterized protein P884DRAFT_273681, partial [Thermothelomyces heterothallicus CBS 202.75]|uniref:uncharacterized protein n=1 Tax=Thermothelomyces heterothallicus CBS 202.75 TaxID=1149848 RepID=UPI0037435478
VIGRLYRMGQGQVVRWHIVMCSGTYSIVQEDKMCRKIVPEILFTGRIPKRIKGRTLRLMVAYEILRMKFAHPFNRFAWVVNPPSRVEDYTSPAMVRMGHFISSIVEQVLSMKPTEDNENILNTLESMVFGLLHWFKDNGDRRQNMFKLADLDKYEERSRKHKIDCPEAPFWKPRNSKMNVHHYFAHVTDESETPDPDAQSDLVDNGCTCVCDPGSCLYHRRMLGFNEDLPADHPANLDAPNNLRELTDTICQFLEKNNLARPYEFEDPNIRNDPLPVSDGQPRAHFVGYSDQDLEERRAEIGSDMSETELQESFMEGIIEGATEMEERSRWSGDNLFNLVHKKAVEILGDAAQRADTSSDEDNDRPTSGS